MENYQQEERKLCIMDCIWNVIFKWRMVIVFVVLFAALFGGFRYAKDFKANAEIQESGHLEITMEDVQNRLQELSDIDRTDAETTMHLIKSLTDKKKYAQDAAVMKLDCYNVNRIMLRYYVESEKNSSELLQAYSGAYLEPEALDSLVAAADGMVQADDVVDMITTQDGRSGNQSYVTDKYMAADEDTLLYITVRGNSREQARKLADRVKLIIEEYSAEAERIYGKHLLVLTSESYLNGRDVRIEDLQDKVYKAIYEMNRDVIEFTGKMSQEAAQIADDYNVLLNRELDVQDDSESMDEEGSDEVVVSVSKKWILFGAVFGAMIIGGIELLLWLLGGKLNSPEELQQNFNIPIYGLFEERKKRKVLWQIDELLYKLKNKNKKILNEEQAFQMISSGICLNAKKEKISSVYLIGTEIELTGEKRVVKQLKQELAKDKIDLIIGKNILCDSKAFLEMAEIGTVILLEEVRHSKYQDIVRELELCRNQGINILGSVIFTH